MAEVVTLAALELGGDSLFDVGDFFGEFREPRIELLESLSDLVL